MDPYAIILHPYVTEKTMNHMENTNALEFVVRRSASKQDVKQAIEEMFDVKVAEVRTKISKIGKHAIVTFASGVNAEDIGMRIGIF